MFLTLWTKKWVANTEYCNCLQVLLCVSDDALQISLWNKWDVYTKGARLHFVYQELIGIEKCFYKAGGWRAEVGLFWWKTTTILSLEEQIRQNALCWDNINPVWWTKQEKCQPLIHLMQYWRVQIKIVQSNLTSGARQPCTFNFWKAVASTITFLILCSTKNITCRFGLTFTDYYFK